MKLAKLVYLLIILISIVITPYAIKYATDIRGYKAYGGEYLIPILGWIFATIFYEIFKAINQKQNFKTRRGKHEQEYF